MKISDHAGMQFKRKVIDDVDMLLTFKSHYHLLCNLMIPSKLMNDKIHRNESKCIDESCISIRIYTFKFVLQIHLMISTISLQYPHKTLIFLNYTKQNLCLSCRSVLM